MGGRGYGGGGRGRVDTYRYTVTTRMTSCIKMGSDESHFNVSLIVMDKDTRQCPQTTTFQEKGEPKRYRTEVLPLTSLPPYRWAKPALSPVVKPRALRGCTCRPRFLQLVVASVLLWNSVGHGAWPVSQTFKVVAFSSLFQPMASVVDCV